MKTVNNKLFISFLTAGDPSLTKTKEYIEILSEYSDYIEVGIPFSDPAADGKVIEKANTRALNNGTTVDKIFDMLKTVKLSSDKNCKLVFLSYINPIFFYGYEQFAKRCNETKICGVVVPDMPLEEQGEVKAVFDKYNISLIPLVAPTSADRTPNLVKDAKEFVYLVSSLGTTGTSKELELNRMKDQIKQIKAVTSAPVCVGFGISTKAQAGLVRSIADGVIVGSSIVSIIEQYKDNAGENIRLYIKQII